VSPSVEKSVVIHEPITIPSKRPRSMSVRQWQQWVEDVERWNRLLVAEVYPACGCSHRQSGNGQIGTHWFRELCGEFGLSQIWWCDACERECPVPSHLGVSVRGK